MANWDQEKLEKVVNQKYVNRPNATKIVSRKPLYVASTILISSISFSNG